MARSIPSFDIDLSKQVNSSLGISKAGEISRFALRKHATLWNIDRLEALYELAFLRIFIAWEMCQEAVFYRSLCGYASKAGIETLVVGVVQSGTHFRTIADAQRAVLGPRRQYVHWYDPRIVISRCQGFIQAQSPAFPLCIGQMENVIASDSVRLGHFANIRHRIAHGQDDAKRKFDLASLAIAARTYPASRPGRFLREADPASVPKRTYLETIANELAGLASQIV